MKKNKAKAGQDSKQEKINQAVIRFSAEINLGISAIGRAAKIYVEAVRSFGLDAEAKFRSSFPNVTDTTWDKLRRIGNADLPAQALLLTGTLFARVERMPKDKRDKFFENGQGVEIYNTQLGKPELVPYAKIMPRHSLVLYKPDGSLRTMQEQKEYATSLACKCTPPKCAWSVENDTLVVHKKCRIGKHELQAILAGME